MTFGNSGSGFGFGAGEYGGMDANLAPGATSFNNPTVSTGLGTNEATDNLAKFKKTIGNSDFGGDLSQYYGQNIAPNDNIRGQRWQDWRRDHLRYVMQNDPGFLASDEGAKYRGSLNYLKGRLGNKGNAWDQVAMAKDPINDFNERYNEWRVKNGAKPVHFNKVHIGYEGGGSVHHYDNGGNVGTNTPSAMGAPAPSAPPPAAPSPMSAPQGGMPPPPPPAPPQGGPQGGGMPPPPWMMQQNQQMGPQGMPPPPPWMQQGGMPPPPPWMQQGGPQGGPPPWMQQGGPQMGPQGGPPPWMQQGPQGGGMPPPPPQGGPQGLRSGPPRGGQRPQQRPMGPFGMMGGLGGAIGKGIGSMIGKGAGMLGGAAPQGYAKGGLIKRDGVALRGKTKCKIV